MEIGDSEILIAKGELLGVESKKGFSISIPTFGVDKQNKIYFFGDDLHFIIFATPIWWLKLILRIES